MGAGGLQAWRQGPADCCLRQQGIAARLLRTLSPLFPPALSPSAPAPSPSAPAPSPSAPAPSPSPAAPSPSPAAPSPSAPAPSPSAPAPSPSAPASRSFTSRHSFFSSPCCTLASVNPFTILVLVPPLLPCASLTIWQCDSKSREVKPKEAQAWANKNGYLYFETSANRLKGVVVVEENGCGCVDIVVVDVLQDDDDEHDDVWFED
eukprot:768440-Hanusia_phi.AAC.7